MEENQIERLYQILDRMEAQGKNPKKIQEIRNLIKNERYIDAFEKIKKFDEEDDDEYEEEYENDMNLQNEDNNYVRTIYQRKLENQELEEIYIGILLNNPKLITKYYILYEDCFF